MKKILIAETSELFSSLLSRRVTDDSHTECVVCTSYRETVALLDQNADQFMLAVLDMSLPDAAEGEVVDFVLSRGIPVVAVTSHMDAQVREKVLDRQIIDYVVKGPHALDQLTGTAKRYLRNQDVSLLLVDSCQQDRQRTRKILESQQYQILEADNAPAALKLVRENPAIKLVIADYQTAPGDGFRLTTEIRKMRPMNKLAIIGASAYGNPLLSSQFLKLGANDFLTKPFFEEELISRVNQNIDTIDNIAQLREAAIKDQLTGLYNRRYFFEAGEKLFENARRQNLAIAIAMIDIDHFKKINDLYGHAGGDASLIAIGEVLQQSFRVSDVVARFGGEEFIIMTVNMAATHRFNHFEALRSKIEQLAISSGEETIRATVSIGVSTSLEDSLDEILQKSDELLYRAKTQGRNRVIIE